MPIARLLVPLLLLPLVGCAAPSNGTDPTMHPAVGEEVRALRFPFDEYQPSRLDMQAIEYAEDLHTRDCMRERGMDWEMLPQPSNQDPDPVNRRRYGLIEAKLASWYGYHLPPRPPELAARDVVWQRREHLPPAEQVAAYGSDRQRGCWDVAHAALSKGLPPAAAEQLHRLAIKAFEESQKKPEVVHALDRWSDCMNDSGFRYAHPFDALGDPSWARSSRPSAYEVAVAEADVRCKEKTGLVTTWATAERRVQRDFIQLHPKDFADLKGAKEAQLDAALRALESHG